MAKIRAIKSMITSEPSNFQPVEIAEGQTSTPNVQDKGVVLALANEQAASWSKKRLRRNQTEQHLVDKDSTKHPSADLGEQTD